MISQQVLKQCNNGGTDIVFPSLKKAGLWYETLSFPKTGDNPKQVPEVYPSSPKR